PGPRRFVPLRTELHIDVGIGPGAPPRCYGQAPICQRPHKSPRGTRAETEHPVRVERLFALPRSRAHEVSSTNMQRQGQPASKRGWDLSRVPSYVAGWPDRIGARSDKRIPSPHSRPERADPDEWLVSVRCSPPHTVPSG